MESNSFYVIKINNKFLKGNGKARYLSLTPHAHKASLLKTIKGIQNRVDNLKKNGYHGEIYVIEIIYHGTIDEIVEREVL